jgi:hypothetical protein
VWRSLEIVRQEYGRKHNGAGLRIGLAPERAPRLILLESASASNSLDGSSNFVNDNAFPDYIYLSELSADIQLYSCPGIREVGQIKISSSTSEAEWAKSPREYCLMTRPH